MLALYRTLSLRYLSRRWFRAVLIVASIALGVATLVATRALNETMSKALAVSNNPLAGTVDLIVSNGDLPVPASLAEEIAAAPGVRSAWPRSFGRARLVDSQGRRNVLVVGIDSKDALKDLGKRAGAVMLSPGTEAAFGLAKLLGQTPAVVGKELDRDLPAKAKQLTVEKIGVAHAVVRVGTIEGRGKLAVLGGYVLVLEQEAAAAVLGLPAGQVSRIDVRLARGAHAGAVRGAIEQVVAGRACVQTPAEHSQAAGSPMAGVRAGFDLCGVAALVVGMFLVYNALAVSVAERRHEIGILLAVGATRAQIRRLFAGEAALLGLVGGLAGIPLGVGLAYLGLRPMQSILSDLFTSLDARQVEVSLRLLLLALLAGIVSATGAALVPALQAAQECPAEAVRRIPRASSARHLLLQLAGSVTLILMGAVLMVARGALPPRLGTFGGLSLVLIGALTASPFLAALGARLLQPLARRFLPVEWRLAADNLVRAPRRTGLVIGALAAAVALVVQTAGVIRSNRLALRQWLDTSYTADLLVTAGSPIGSGEQATPMDEAVGAELRRLPEVEAALPERYHKVVFQGVQVTLLAVEAGEVYRLQKQRLPPGEDGELFRQLDGEQDGALVSANFAALYGVGAGDTLTLPGPDGPVMLRILGQVVDYSWNLGTIFLNRRDHLRHWQDARVDLFDLYLRRGADAGAVKEKVTARFGARYDLQPLTRSELTAAVDEMIERLYGIAYGQQIVVMLVAALGVVTALLIAVLQRRRELGLLRAVGAPRGQVIHAVLAEACLMGLLGTVLGICVGIPLQWYVLRVVILDEAGFSFPVHMPWAGAVLIAAAALATAALAGLGPALYAVRQRIPEAIAYE
jgi:putative ABC transport system permease protein